MSESNDQKFSESEKTGDDSYYDNPALDAATKEMFRILDEEPPKQGPVKPALAKLLREVQTQQLFAGERDENGRQIIKGFDHWVKTTRRLYVGRGGASTSDKYKHVVEALTFNRLEDSKLSPLPIPRSVNQKVGTVEPELQVVTWAQTLKDAAGRKITPMLVAKAAIAAGSKTVKLPSRSVSSKMPDMRKDWTETKFDLREEFGLGVDRHFTRMDHWFATRVKEASDGTGIGPENVGGTPNQVDTQSMVNAEPQSGETTVGNLEANSGVTATAPHNDLENAVSSKLTKVGAPSNQHVATHDGPEQGKPAADTKVDGTTAPDRTQAEVVDGDQATTAPANPLLSARVWHDDTGVMIGFRSKDQKAAVQEKLNFWRLGYRWDLPKKYWRRRIDIERERKKAYATIIEEFSNAGVVVETA